MAAEYKRPFRETVESKLIDIPSDDPRAQSSESKHMLTYELPPGTEILASRAGTVIEAKVDDLAGLVRDEYAAHQTNLVNLDHGDGTYALYIHLTPVVEPDQQVPVGEQIGNSGGYVPEYGPHLHLIFYRILEGKVVSFPVDFSD